ncbi:carbohydrate ABC transporter permease [Streptomyces chiangmaiensis]|uniref:Carbohydrate ABC transporter permease n=1 Tax=Streptomyces chiangmaiensis TaxID=766497 RepID=A0ABU7FPW8_9ACTN|nr:carbohydrate ABC transporter permease [Streptomyces chiangmaiensis]MED7825159.1 carbohydrate ABC transporter permease [Streptomyces chiangmaiensis]
MTWKPRDPQEVLPPRLRGVAITLISAFALLPVLFMVLMSLTPDNEVAAGTLWPSRFAFSNYANMWHTVSLGPGLGNSLIAAVTAAVIATALAVGAAYCLTRFTFPGRRIFLTSLVMVQSLPGTLLILPLFMVFSSIGSYLGLTVVGTRGGLIITYLTFALPLATWVMVTYLRKIPESLEEAGLVDGLTRFGTLWRITVPLSWPGMTVALVFSFLLGWNDVLFASILTQPGTRTVGVQLQILGLAAEGGAIPLYGQLLGASVVSAVPVVLLYLFFQRYLVGGLTSGGVKG